MTYSRKRFKLPKDLQHQFSGTEWTKDDIHRGYDICSYIARNKYNLSWYEPQFEIVNEEGMLHAVCTAALPTLYEHWSYGKQFIEYQKEYRANRTNPAFEVIINSNPSVCYLLASNTLMTMIDVISHAAIGHSSFFKNNYLFQEWTNADTILPFCTYAKRYVNECENKYGYKEVEWFFDFLHAVQNMGVDKSHPPIVKTKRMMEEALQARAKGEYENAHWLFDSLNNFFAETKDSAASTTACSNLERDDNLLRLMLKYAPFTNWQKDLVHISMFINQYFYPQIKTKLMNEGWAVFWDRLMLDDMHDLGVLGNAEMLESIYTSSLVTHQGCFSKMVDTEQGMKPGYNQYYRGLNVYCLGHELFKEIKRVCEEQDEESLRWVPSLRGVDWLSAVTHAMENFRDDSFVYQFLTPNLARKLKLAQVSSYGVTGNGVVVSQNHGSANMIYRHIDMAHDDDTFDILRQSLSEQYSGERWFPVVEACVEYDTSAQTRRRVPKLTLIYDSDNPAQLVNEDRIKVIKLIERYWKGDVNFCTSKTFRARDFV